MSRNTNDNTNREDSDFDTRTEKSLSKKIKIKAKIIPNARFKPIPPLFLLDATVTARIVKIRIVTGKVYLLFLSRIWLDKRGEPLALSIFIKSFSSNKLSVLAWYVTGERSLIEKLKIVSKIFFVSIVSISPLYFLLK